MLETAANLQHSIAHPESRLARLACALRVAFHDVVADCLEHPAVEVVAMQRRLGRQVAEGDDIVAVLFAQSHAVTRILAAADQRQDLHSGVCTRRKLRQLNQLSHERLLDSIVAEIWLWWTKAATVCERAGREMADSERTSRGRSHSATDSERGEVRNLLTACS